MPTLIHVDPHIHTIYYDGINLATYGVHVSGEGTYGAPERDIESVEVPGRSGDLIYDKKRYKNTTVTYHAFIAADTYGLETTGFDFDEKIANFRNFLYRARGYKRLEDTYHPEEYRLGIVSGSLDPTVYQLSVAEFDLTFNCKPQRFLKFGEVSKPYDYTGSSVVLENPTMQDAKPIIRITGVGNLQIQNDSTIFSIDILDHDDIPYIDIDCDMSNAYYDASNCNSYVKLSNDEFPVLTPGSNYILLGSGITHVEITPRWWKI